jgi:flagellar biosynthesis anti-sigma factor FlgM
MKIQNPNDLGAVSTPGVRDTSGLEGISRKDSSRAAEVAGAGADKAELSGLAAKISEAQEQDSAVRAAKVEHLRQLVASGEYQPDPEAISRGIVNDALSNAASAGGTGKS